jgi:hypothetical protein
MEANWSNMNSTGHTKDPSRPRCAEHVQTPLTSATSLSEIEGFQTLTSQTRCAEWSRGPAPHHQLSRVNVQLLTFVISQLFTHLLERESARLQASG